MNPAIDTVNREFEAAFKAGDAARMAAVYTTDGSVLPTNSPTISGTEGLTAFWQGVLDMGIASATLKTVELEEHGSTAIELGEFALENAAGEVLDHGKFIVVWKQQGGLWRWHKDIFNSSRPAA